jgi:signal transduction histidine kinase
LTRRPFLLVAALFALAPGAALARSPAAQAARLRSEWGDLERRADAFVAAPALQRVLHGGGIAVDRAALFSAAAAALAGAPESDFLILTDPAGEPLAWAGHAPALVPARDARGAVWSVDSVVVRDVRVIELPGETRKPRLIRGWSRPRRLDGVALAPAGGIPWKGEPGLWGTIVPDVASHPRQVWWRGRMAVAALAALSLCAILLARAVAARRGISPAVAVAAFALAVGAAVQLRRPAEGLDPLSYFGSPGPLLGLAMAMLAAAIAAPRPRRGWVIAGLAAAAAAIGAGALLPAAAWPIAVALAAATVLLFPRGTAGRTMVAGALGAAALLSALVSARATAESDRTRRELTRQTREDPNAQEIAAGAGRAVPSALAREADRMAAAPEQDLSDLAFAVWRDSGLSEAAPVSGIRLWHSGRLVSRFAFGIPADTAEDVLVGGERVGIARRRILLPPVAGFPAGEAPDEADVEVARWPRWRALPEPLSDYRPLLAESREPPPASTSAPGRRLLDSFGAAMAAGAATFAIGAIGLLLPATRRFSLRPATFRGRVTALFTVLVLLPYVAATVFIRQTMASRLRRETVVHAQTALSTAVTVLDDYLFASAATPVRRELIDDDLLSWIARVVGHDLSIYADGVLYSSSRRELFSSGALSGRVRGESLGRILAPAGGYVVESRRLRGRPFDQVQAPLASLPGAAARAGPAVLAIPLLPEQREAEREIARLSASLSAFTLCVFGLSLLLGARVAYRVTGPIGELVEATRAVSRGEVPAVDPPGDEELARLVDAFRSMAETLAQQREDLARANRLRAWAEMARIIAHEIKNPLTPIRLSAEHLRAVARRKDPALGRVLEECVANILAQTETLRGIASEFADYARLPEPTWERVELAEAFAQAVRAYAAAPAIRFETDAGGLAVRADRKLLARALANVAGNSVEALGAAGGGVKLSAELRGDRVVVRVADDGPGLAEGDIPRLFEPSFSTKTGGTGLGLAIVRKIAREHGGDVQARNVSPRGFEVEFDLAKAEV